MQKKSRLEFLRLRIRAGVFFTLKGAGLNARLLPVSRHVASSGRNEGRVSTILTPAGGRQVPPFYSEKTNHR